MNQRTLRILEFDIMLEKLISFSESEGGKTYSGKLLPTKDYQEVLERLNETSEAVGIIQRRGSPKFMGNYDLHDIVRRMELGAILNPSEILKIGSSLKTARHVKAVISEEVNREYISSVQEKIQTLFTRRTLEERIFSIIVSEEEIDDYASPMLLSIRRNIVNRQNSIRSLLTEMIRSTRYQKYIQDPVVTIRQDRYCISVKQECRNEIKGIIHDTSSSGATVFLEPLSVIEANNEIRHLQSKEQLEVERILAELTQDCAQYHNEILQNCLFLSELDFIFAKARLSISYQGIKPKLNRDKRIRIKAGRHPLIEKEKVVPIDFHIGDQISSIVITGPNTGGKTVTLKTMGLFALLTQSGIFIPSKEGTEMTVFQNIFADIGDEQSILQSLSTFSSHMKHVIEIVSQADDESLVLLDELGAGTDPAEGSSLAISILEYLRQRGAITLATTHYSELKAYAISNHGVLNASCEFDVETLSPTYKILIGIPGKSNAFSIAERLGIPSEILSAAKNLMTKEAVQMEDMLYDIQKNLRETENDKVEIQEILKRIQTEEEATKQLKITLDTEKKNILQKAKEEALQIVRDAKKQAQGIVKELHQLRSIPVSKDSINNAEEARRQLQDLENNAEGTLYSGVQRKVSFSYTKEELQIGDIVFVPQFQQNGEVLAKANKSGEVLLQVGSIKIHVPYQQLEKAKKETTKTNTFYRGFTSSKTKTIRSEIDVRGMVVLDALEVVDKYLDDAVLAGLKDVRVIHGKGTGSLREALNNHFKAHPHIVEYRIGRYGEGEMGVTIITLK